MTGPLAPTGLRPGPRSGPRPDQDASLALAALVVESFGRGLAMAFVGGLLVYAGSDTREMLEAAGQQWPFLLYLAFSAGWCWPMAALRVFKTAPDRRSLAAMIGVSCTGVVASVLLWRGPEILLWSLPCLGAALLPWLEPWLCPRLGLAPSLFERINKIETPPGALNFSSAAQILLGDAAMNAGNVLLVRVAVFFVPLVQAKTKVVLQPWYWPPLDVILFLVTVHHSFRRAVLSGQAFACALVFLGLALALGPAAVMGLPDRPDSLLGVSGPLRELFWWMFWVPFSIGVSTLLFLNLKRKRQDRKR